MFITYNGKSDVRIVWADDFADHGLTSPTLEWNKANGYTIDVPPEIGAFLLAQGEFYAESGAVFGEVIAGDGPSVDPHLIVATAAGNVAVIARGYSPAQSADIVQAQRSDGLVLAAITKEGHFLIRTNEPSTLTPWRVGAVDVPWTNGPPAETNYTDHVAFWGYNVTQAGYATSPKSSVFIQLEHRFYHTFPSGDSDFGSEFHVNHYNEGNTKGARSIGSSFNNRTGEVSLAFQGNFVFQKSDASIIWMQLNESNKLLGLESDVSLRITPLRTDRGQIDIGGQTGNYPSILATAGVDQVLPLLDLRNSSNASVFSVLPDGTVSFPSGITAMVGYWSWTDGDSPAELASFNDALKQVEFLDDVALRVTPTDTALGHIRLGSPAPYATFYVAAGSTQVMDLINFRTPANALAFQVKVDGETNVGARGLVVNFTQNEGAAITAQPRVVGESILRGRSLSGQTADLMAFWNHDATKRLYAVDKDGYPLIPSVDGTKLYRLAIDSADETLVTTEVI